MDPQAPLFKNRSEAGQALAARLFECGREKTLVLALPRGGVPVAYEVAKALQAPLDTVVARKIGAPANGDFAIGAIAPGDVLVLEKELIAEQGMDQNAIEALVAHELGEMNRRIHTYASGSYSRDFDPETVIVVDDGVATGLTAYAALESVRLQWHPRTIIFASPICSEQRANKLADVSVNVLCAYTVDNFVSISHWYGDFSQLSDKEVLNILKKRSEEWSLLQTLAKSQV